MKNKKKTKVQNAAQSVESTLTGLLSPTVPSTTAPVLLPTPMPGSASTQPTAPAQTVPEKIWADIKDKPIEMFALPGQTPAKFCTPIMVEPTKLYLTSTVSSVLPALETAFSKTYDVELVDRYIVLSYKTNLPKK